MVISRVVSINPSCPILTSRLHPTTSKALPTMMLVKKTTFMRAVTMFPIINPDVLQARNCRHCRTVQNRCRITHSPADEGILCGSCFHSNLKWDRFRRLSQAAGPRPGPGTQYPQNFSLSQVSRLPSQVPGLARFKLTRTRKSRSVTSLTVRQWQALARARPPRPLVPVSVGASDDDRDRDAGPITVTP